MSGRQYNSKPTKPNSYSYFFRESDVIEMIRQHVLLPSVASQQRVSIWCVGCATGDEAYSLAIVAREVNARIALLATDINREALQQAREGRYAPRSLRHVSHARKRRWFVDEGMTQVVSAELKQQVTFSEHNIVTDAPPAPFQWNLILCRNVLLYLDEEETRRAISSIIDVLAPQGLLILGASESMGLGRRRWPSGRPRLELLDVGGVLVYAKIAHNVEVPDADLPDADLPATLPPMPSTSPEQQQQEAESRPSVDDLRARGDTMLNRGNIDGALLCYAEASEQSPLDADLYLRLGLCHLLIEDQQRARTDLRKALFLDATLWQAAWLLGDLLADEDRPAAAPYFDRVKELLEQKTQYAEPSAEEAVLQPFLPGCRVALEAARVRLQRIESRPDYHVARYRRLQLKKLGRGD